MPKIEGVNMPITVIYEEKGYVNTRRGRLSVVTKTEYDLPENIIWDANGGKRFMSWNSHFQAYVTDEKVGRVTPKEYVAHMKATNREDELKKVNIEHHFYREPTEYDKDINSPNPFDI